MKSGVRGVFAAVRVDGLHTFGKMEIRMNGIEDIFGVAIAAATGGGVSAPPVVSVPVSHDPGVMDNRQAGGVPTTTAMCSLAAFVDKTFITNANARRNAGVDAKLRYCIMSQTCQYTPEQKAKMKAAGIDERVYAPITATKVRAAKAMLNDIFNSASDRPWTLSPTPDPTLPKKVVEECYQKIQLEIQFTFIKLAQMGVQALPPKYEQLLKTLIMKRTADRYEEIMNFKRNFARSRAKRLEEKVHDMMIEGGWVKAFSEYCDYICTYGTGLIIGPVPRVVPVQRCKETNLGTVKYVREYELKPTWEAVNPMDCYPAPDAKDVEDGPLCIRIKYSPNELWQYVNKVGAKKNPDTASGWMVETVKALLDLHPQGGVKLNIEPYDPLRRLAERGGHEDPEDCTFEGVRCFASVRGSMLIEMGITKNRNGKIINWSEFYRVETIVIDGFVVYCRIIDDRFGVPISKGVFYEIPGSWWGEAIADKLFLVQNTMNNAIKSLMQNMAAASGPMYWMKDVSSVVDRDGSGLKMRPHKMWFFNNNGMGSPNSGAPIGTIQVPSNASELMSVWDKMKLQADDDSGIPAYTYGQSSGQGGALRTSSGLQIFTEAASRGMKMVVSTSDRLVTRDQVHKAAVWVLLYDSDPEVKGDCEVLPDGVMGKILRAQQEQQRQQLLATFSKNPYLLQMVGPKGLMALLRPTIQDVGINPDDVLPSEARLEELELLEKIKQLAAAQNGMTPQGQQSAEPGADGGAQPEQPGGGGEVIDVGSPEEPAPGSANERRNVA